MDALDFLLFPIYLGIFYLLGVRTVNKNSNNPLYRIYYMRGLNYRFMGSLGFAFIYIYYYKGGDTISFYYCVAPLFKLFFTNPASFFGFVFSYRAPYPPECMWEAGMHSVIYLLRGSATLTTIRIAGLLDILCLNSYLALSLCFGFISYQFQWRAFALLSSIYPKLHKRFAIAFLMIPSVIFWGSGLSKDCVMLGGIMLFFYSYYNMVIIRKQFFKYFIIFALTGFIMSLIRGFILFTILPCLMLMTVIYYRNNIQSSFLRFLIGPLMIGGGILGTYMLVRGIGSEVQSYTIESLQKKAEGFQSWHQYLGETKGGSAYSLGGEVEYTTSGVIRHAPIALATTLFGPFIWQVRNPVMLISAVESLIFLYFTLSMLFNRRIYSLGGILVRDHIVVFCIPFTLILGVAIGLTSFNYGALVRYKIPIMPFFATALILIDYHLNYQRVK
jgi:hypothetical protein